MIDKYSQLEEAHANTTPGYWIVAEEIDGWMHGRMTVVKTTHEDYQNKRRIVTVDQTRRHDTDHAEANCSFIALAHDEVPNLIQENRMLREALALALENKPTKISFDISHEDYVVAREVEKATVPGRWFQAIDEDGRLLAETSTPSDFGPDSLDLIGKPGVTFLRQYRAELEDWREIDAADLPMTPRNHRRYSE